MKKLLSVTLVGSAVAVLFSVNAGAANAQVGTILPTDVTGITSGGVGPTGVLNRLQQPVYTSSGFGMPASQLYGRVLTQPSLVGSTVLTQPSIIGGTVLTQPSLVGTTVLTQPSIYGDAVLSQPSIVGGWNSGVITQPAVVPQVLTQPASLGCPVLNYPDIYSSPLDMTNY